MGVTYLGGLTVGECVPAAVTMQAALLADLQAQLAAQAELVLQLNLNPGSFTIAAALETALGLVASIQAQIALGIELPSIQVQLDAAVAFSAALQISIDLLLALQVAFGTAGVHAFSVDGAVNTLGGQLSGAFAGGFPGPGNAPTDYANALVLATSVPAAWAALGQILKTS